MGSGLGAVCVPEGEGGVQGLGYGCRGFRNLGLRPS